MSWLAWALLILMKRVSKLRMARRLEFIHFARWQRIRSKKLPRLSPLQPKENFAYDFFLFASNYNGDWDQYIDTFARVSFIRRGMWWLWRFSQGYPGPFPIRTFKEWIRYQTYPELLYYCAYPHSTVRNITAALTVKDQLDRFLDATSDAESASDFKKRYLTMVREVAPHLGSAPGLTPGPVPPSSAPPLRPILGRLSRRGDRVQSFITAMSPIEVRPDHEVTDRVIERITKVTSGAEPTPFAQCPMLHMARILIIDDLRPSLGVSPKASLKTNYLLFLADIDGPVGDFLDCLYEADPSFVDGVWGNCLGYPSDLGGPVFFRRYIERSRLPVHLPFVAFPGHTAVEIHGALQLHVDLLEWMARGHANMKEDDLKVAWQTWLQHFAVGK